MSDTYIAALLDGRASIDDFRTYVARWHDEDIDHPAPSVEEYLGLTWEEYRMVALDESRLRFVAAARRHGQPLESFEQHPGQLALAARAGHSDELTSLVTYLVDQGVLDS